MDTNDCGRFASNIFYHMKNISVTFLSIEAGSDIKVEVSKACGVSAAWLNS